MPAGTSGSWSIEFTRSAFKEFMRLDAAVRERIAESLEWLAGTRARRSSTSGSSERPYLCFDCG